MPSAVYLFCSACLSAVVLASAQPTDYERKNPAADDPRIQKQQPFHWGTPPPNHRVKLDFVPIKVLASVRHEKATKFVPREEALSEASTPEELILAKRLKEAITTKKLGEVYTEQGYEDQKYDHGHYEKQGRLREKFENEEKKEHRTNEDSPEDQAPHASVKIPKSTTKNEASVTVDIEKYPFYKTAPKNSPQRYASNPKFLPDKKNNPDMPFYASTNYKECPDISPVLSVGPDDKNPKGEPRLRGLGDKIDCLVSKYFGSDPFENPFFKEENVHADTINPKYLLPSETNNGPVLFITNATFQEMAESEAKMKKFRDNNSGKRKKQTGKSGKATPATEVIEGMMPPPLPIKLRKTRDISTPLIYSTRQGGVKFVAEPEKGVAPLPIRRLSASSKYGSRNYEVTEEPEEAADYPLAAKVARPVKFERHRLNQEERALYSSTYVPDTSVPNTGVTTTIWNAAPREPENVELSSTIVEKVEPSTSARPIESRKRARVHAAIPEDIFQGRGERRIRPAAENQPEVKRTRQRLRAPKRVETVAIDSQITTINKYAEHVTLAPERPRTRPLIPIESPPAPVSEQNAKVTVTPEAEIKTGVELFSSTAVTASPLPETTTIFVPETTPVTLSPRSGRQRLRSKVERTRQSATTPSAETDSGAEKSSARRTSRRGKQRSKSDETEKPAARNAPQSSRDAAPEALNQRARATSPVIAAADRQQQITPTRTRGRKRFNLAEDLKTEEQT
ncbi:uncharacterized protein LOC132204010 [Neocloeon triangulifer]|uniref:uncharacterized protein LOC132204010 n=1 Tax=Neocloeon triangulifer TaxID=2078957 RepID=UPI00286EF97C|nr:uncharacterized protein LOC132204010 [Neocloeon triangulifer]